MQLLKGARWRWPGKRTSRDLPYDVAEIALIVALAWGAVMFVWTLVRPLGPVGHWQAVGSRVSPSDPGILTRFDPFFRSAGGGPTAVTSLPLKLFGVRIDSAMGRGSAIIATPDGVQGSFAVGDEIVPGVILKSVALDSITIARGGIDEQLFLDQSGATTPATAGMAGAAPTLPNLQSVQSAVAFAPRMVDGRANGVVLNPKGDAAAFAALGLRPGDVLTQVNARGTMTVEEAAAALAAVAPGQALALTVERGGQMTTINPGAAK